MDKRYLIACWQLLRILVVFQVSEICPLTLDVQEGDHAMIIRNHRGDFGICVARWQPNINFATGRTQLFLPVVRHGGHYQSKPSMQGTRVARTEQCSRFRTHAFTCSDANALQAIVLLLQAVRYSASRRGTNLKFCWGFISLAERDWLHAAVSSEDYYIITEPVQTPVVGKILFKSIFKIENKIVFSIFKMKILFSK